MDLNNSRTARNSFLPSSVKIFSFSVLKKEKKFVCVMNNRHMRNKVAPPLALKRGGYSLGVIRRDRNDVGAGLTWPRMIVTPQSGTFNNNNNTTPVTHTLELTNFTLFSPPHPATSVLFYPSDL
jgi:hypothetical protein